jgi:transcriptional regulator of acetoin/glycerol metabolism
MNRLVNYEWPGRVREFENTIKRACALSERGVIHTAVGVGVF